MKYASMEHFANIIAKSLQIKVPATSSGRSWVGGEESIALEAPRFIGYELTEKASEIIGIRPMQILPPNDNLYGYLLLANSSEFIFRIPLELCSYDYRKGFED